MSARLLRHPLDAGWSVRRVAGPELDDVLPGLADGVPAEADLNAGLPATVPGSIHTDLLAVGLIPDPFAADNELRVQWVGHSDWEYSAPFVVDASLLALPAIDLVCEGLDTVAEVQINGALVGHAGNMFRTWRWPVKALLHAGENRISVRFRSAPAWCAERDAVRPLPQANAFFPGAPYLRKAPYHFGWDWGPMLPTAGIWRPIFLEAYSARLDDLQIVQHHQAGAVSLTVRAAVDGTTPAGAGSAAAVEVRVTAPDGQVFSGEGVLAQGAAAVVLPLEQPELWWPNGMGGQPLYAVEVRLIDGAGEVLDSAVRRVGLRTIELRQEPDRWGSGFVFAVNGVPFFAKGANWIPADSFPARVSDALYAHLLTSAAAAHMNMIRVWGGGFYEDERFYTLCDELGLLVWQDFMFSCSVYPFVDPAFLETVAAEVMDNVRRLRHRPCMALWCGNNELEAGWTHWGWATAERRDLQEADKEFFYSTLRRQVQELDPSTPYWPGSPSSNLPHTLPQSDATGDTHRWEVWHELRPFSHYLTQIPRFVSEFGFQSLPPLATIATYAPPDEWNMTSYLMEHHQRNTDGNGRIVAYLSYHFRLPSDFPSLVYLSQVLQAEAMRTAVEHWRRQWPRTAGALYWQLDDCWPVASWASLDSFGRWKALHYGARRFFAPLTLSVEPGERLSGTVAAAMALGETGLAGTASATVWIHNDLLTEQGGELRWSLETLDGAVLQQASEAVQVAANMALPLRRLDFTSLLSGSRAPSRRNVALVAELWVAGERRALSLHTFVPSKHLTLRDPALRSTLHSDEAGNLLISLEAGYLARFVEVALEGADVVFSDNYFDLPAGDTVTVRCALPAGWDVARASAALRVRSLYNSAH
jgi:beta-mannosidase